MVLLESRVRRSEVISRSVLSESSFCGTIGVLRSRLLRKEQCGAGSGRTRSVLQAAGDSGMVFVSISTSWLQHVLQLLLSTHERAVNIGGVTLSAINAR